MKILHITDGISPFVVGGMQRHSHYLVKYLVKQGHDVCLIHSGNRLSAPDTHETRKILGLREDASLATIWIPFPTKKGLLPGHYVRNSRTYSEKVFEMMKDRLELFDFIYAKGFTGWKIIEEKSNYRTPIGVNFHGYEMFQLAEGIKSKLEQRLFRKAVKKINREADFVFSYGSKISEIIRTLGVPDARIIEVPSGIERDWLHNSVQTNAKRKFVFVGRNERRKGMNQLISLLPELLKKDNVEFHFIGPIPIDQQIANKNAIYHGLIKDNQELKILLRSMDVLVCPSFAEGMPNAILEGMASSLAVIASNVGAIDLMVSKDNGWLIAPGNEEMLKKSFESALSISDLELLKMKNSSHNKINSNFLWDEIILQTELAIDQVVKGQAAHA